MGQGDTMNIARLFRRKPRLPGSCNCFTFTAKCIKGGQVWELGVPKVHADWCLSRGRATR